MFPNCKITEHDATGMFPKCKITEHDATGMFPKYKITANDPTKMFLTLTKFVPAPHHREQNCSHNVLPEMLGNTWFFVCFCYFGNSFCSRAPASGTILFPNRRHVVPDHVSGTTSALVTGAGNEKNTGNCETRISCDRLTRESFTHLHLTRASGVRAHTAVTMGFHMRAGRGPPPHGSDGPPLPSYGHRSGLCSDISPAFGTQLSPHRFAHGYWFCVVRV